MKMLGKYVLFLLLLCSLALPLTSSVMAADIRGEDSISISGEKGKLINPYLFGGQVEVTAPVTNDLVTAGGNITLENDISGSLWVAGGDIQIKSRVDKSVRVAGGNITIDGPIQEDLIVLGGTVRVTNNASISGDVVFTGGQLRLDAPVGGYVLANGGEITLNAPIKGNVSGEMGQLTLGPQARIGGNLTYTAEEKASIDEGKVAGKIAYKKSEVGQRTKEGVAGMITAGTLYKIIADILFTLLLIWLFRPFITRVLTTIETGYLKSAGLGFVTLMLTPLVGLLLFVIVWLGMSVFLLYGLLLLLSSAVMKLFIGWKAVTWWEERNERTYDVDWKAAVVGVLIVFIIGLIPVLGWLAVFILFLFALGGLTQEVFTVAESQREALPPSHATKASSRKRKK